MNEALERRFFPFVIKPGRYAGGEPGQAIPAGSTYRILLAHPERYDHAWGGLPIQIAYHQLNQIAGCSAERIFAYDTDAEQQLRSEQLRPFALESRSPLNAFDLVACYVADWSGYATLLQLFELSGLPFRSAERDARAPLILGFGPATKQPAPIAPFFDLLLVGEFEEALPHLVSTLQMGKGLDRAVQLRAAGAIDSVYIPSVRSSPPTPSQSIPAAQVSQLERRFYPQAPLQPLIEVAACTLPIEIGRQSNASNGSGELRPHLNRLLNYSETTELAKLQLQATGFSELQITTPPDPQVPQVEQAIAGMAKLAEGSRITVALPPITAGSLSGSSLSLLARVRKHGLTISAEAGSERLRALMHHPGTDADIIQTVHLAYDKGWSTIRLSFKIGLPTETDDDLRALAALTRQCSKLASATPPRKSLQVLLYPFIPTPHTPFQWDELQSESELMRRFHLIRREVREPALQIKLLGVVQARVATALTRGDSDLSAVIETAYGAGARFDGDFDLFNESIWEAAFAANNLSLDAARSPLPFSKPLPWGMIATGRSTEQLQAERTKPLLSLSQSGDAAFLQQAEAAFSAPTAIDAVSGSVGFGRTPKKVASRNLAAPTKNCVRIRWGKSARYRYMSHLENLRFLERLIRKAGLPIAWSSGDRPTMKLSVGPPLPLGFTSEAEYVDLTLETNFTPTMLESFRSALPDGIDLYEASIVFNAKRSLSGAINRAVYQLPITEWSDLAILDSQIETVSHAPALLFQREGQNAGPAPIDLRPFIYDLRRDNQFVSMTLGLGDGGYVRPGEVVSFLSESLIFAPVSLPFHRRRVFRMEPDGRLIDPMQL